MNNDTGSNKKGPIITLVIVVALLFVTLLIWQKIQQSGKTSLEIQKVPGDSIIFVNNKKVSGSKIYLEKGPYTIKAEREGFDSYTRIVTIDPDSNKTPKAFFVLTPKTQEATTWVQDNEDEYLKVEKAAGIYYGDQSKSTVEKYPIIKDLPYRSSFYSIEYYQKGNDFRVQIISSDAMGRQVAIEQIKSLGYDPSDYIVEFVGVDNPFTAAVESKQ